VDSTYQQPNTGDSKPTNSISKYLTVKEVAIDLGVSYITALKYIHNNMLKGIRIGGQWRVTPEELERFKQEGNRSKEGEQ
jgi:excisionase family DNA binding protein